MGGQPNQSADLTLRNHNHADPAFLSLGSIRTPGPTNSQRRTSPKCRNSRRRICLHSARGTTRCRSDSIDIKATNRDLVICARRHAASMSSDSQAPLLSEFRAGSWSRSFRFPNSLDREQLKATYRDGILEITAGKAIEHTSVSEKRIENKKKRKDRRRKKYKQEQD